MANEVKYYPAAKKSVKHKLRLGISRRRDPLSYCVVFVSLSRIKLGSPEIMCTARI
jgi:hypothetical protein